MNAEQMMTEDISLSKDGGLLKRILKEGDGNENPLHRDRVFIHYVARLSDGTVVDSSRQRNKRFEFEMGKGTVIKGWEIGVATMKRGEICQLTCQPAYAYGDQGMGERVKANQTVIFEIELLDFIGEDLSEAKDESIVKRTLTSGEGWTKPKDGSEVEISLKGIYENRVFDERRVKFVIGEGVLHHLPEGLECALTHMTKGEYCQIKLRSRATTDLEKFHIPKSARVEYLVKLINFKKGINKWALTETEKLVQCVAIKKRAAELVKDGHYRVACKKYKTMLGLLQSATEELPNEPQRINDLICACHSNIALCHLKLGEYAACIRACDKVLELNPNHEKSLYRRAQSHMSMTGYEEAINDFQSVLKLNPNNTEAEHAIQTCQDHLKAYEKQEKQLYVKIFTKLAKTTEKTS